MRRSTFQGVFNVLIFVDTTISIFIWLISSFPLTSATIGLIIFTSMSIWTLSMLNKFLCLFVCLILYPTVEKIYSNPIYRRRGRRNQFKNFHFNATHSINFSLIVLLILLLSRHSVNLSIIMFCRKLKIITISCARLTLTFSSALHKSPYLNWLIFKTIIVWI